MRPIILITLPLLAACAAVPQARPGPPPPARPTEQVRTPPPAQPAPRPAAGFQTPTVQRVPGLEPVMERDEAGLRALLGAPRLAVTEGDARKLQYAGETCVLDLFLYPLRLGAAPVVTYGEARRASDGREVDRAACLAALRR